MTTESDLLPELKLAFKKHVEEEDGEPIDSKDRYIQGAWAAIDWMNTRTPPESARGDGRLEQISIVFIKGLEFNVRRENYDSFVELIKLVERNPDKAWITEQLQRCEVVLQDTPPAVRKAISEFVERSSKPDCEQQKTAEPDVSSVTGEKALEQIRRLKSEKQSGNMGWGIELSYQSLCVIEDALEARRAHLESLRGK